MAHDPEVVEIDMAQVEALLARTKERMAPEDYETWEQLVTTHVALRRLVHQRGTTIVRLRRLFGLAQSEKTVDVMERVGVGEGDKADASADAQDAADPAAKKPPEDEEKTAVQTAGRTKRKGHGRDAASAYPDACVFHVLHDKLSIGQRCPRCGRGNLYSLEPKTILRIIGLPPLVGRCWKCDRLRCSGCGAIFEADPPPEARGPKHDVTAAAMIAYLRFRAGMPHNRLEQIQRNLRTPLPASTQWDVIRERCDGPLYLYLALCRLGAQGTVFHTDDTSMPILELMGKRRAKLVSRGDLLDPKRTGLFTTGIVSIVEGHTLALFFTGRQHAGENLADVLRERASGLEAAILMCDGLDRNIPKGYKVVQGNCGSHARRGLVDQAVNWPHECRGLLETYGKVFKIDELCRKEGLSDEERLGRHRAESGPLMDELEKRLRDLLEDKRVEPNSGLGDAINYILERWEKLTLFLRVAGAPLHNNLVERTLKMAIRHRNNSLFYRSELGALLGDIYMSVIYTAELAGENGLQYLTELIRHEKAAAADPAAWLPWSYRATLARLDAAQRAQEEPPRPPASCPPTSRPTNPRPSAPSSSPPAPT